MSHTVVILTEESDSTADRVAAELTVRGVRVIRLDSSDFPRRVSMATTLSTGRSWGGTFCLPSGDLLDVAQVGAVYRRRPTQFVMDERMSSPERAFAYGEARRGFGGVLIALGLSGCLWVNEPAAAARAEYKPVQLAAAAACGLAVPETLITSDPQAAFAWAKQRGRPIIYKPLSGAWHADEGQVRILYTSPVADPRELLDPAVALTAHLLQEQVPKAYEARAVVVADQVFAVRINTASAQARIDWRSDYDALSYEPLDLPPPVAAALVATHRRLGLLYGAADLICDPSGRWVFLETNQGGEWGWLAQQAGLPVAEALAQLLYAGPAWRT